MNYYFKIAGIRIRVESDIVIHWNGYITTFLCAPCEAVDVYYQCKFTDKLVPRGKLIWQDHHQLIFRSDEGEERLHFFWGQTLPCMLYRECSDKNMIYLNECFRESFMRKDNYSIFNAMAFEKVLLRHRAVVLHSSFIIHDGQAILFTAPSGTGKSTQASLWEKYRGAIIANGDRTILRMDNGCLWAYGMPICGSSDICLDVEVPVRTVVYLAQSPVNRIAKVELKQRIKNLMSETTINFFDREFLEEAMEVITEMAKTLSMYFLECTKDEEAVKTLEAQLKENDNGSDKTSESN